MTPSWDAVPPCPRRRQVVTILRMAPVLCIAWMMATPLFAQQVKATVTPSSQTSSVRIEVKTEGSNLSDEEILAALEEAARQVRQRLAASGLAPASAQGAAPAPAPPAVEPAPMPEVATPVPAEEAVDEPHWGNLHFQLLPRSLLWQPPLANQHEPRMEIVATSLNNDNTKKTLDTAIGGTAPLLRVSGDDPHDGVEVDFFGVVLSRFAKYNTLDDADYRFGLPLTWASGPWSAKLSYEHTSSHIGDDFIKWEAAGLEKRGHVRDEVVTGLSYRWWNQLRLYGQFGYAMNLSTAGPMKHDRYDFGLEWSRQVSTGFRGQPFAAIDVDVRGDENHTPNVTAQVGWQWQELDSRLPSLRLAVEFYDGRSPYGQFFDVHEQWIGGGIYLDF